MQKNYPIYFYCDDMYAISTHVSQKTDSICEGGDVIIYISIDQDTIPKIVFFITYIFCEWCL